MTVPDSGHRPLSGAGRARLAAQRIVLVTPSHAGNLGSVARAMTAMGLADLVVVAPRDPGFATDAQAVALASGATDVLDRARLAADLDAAVADCQWVVAVSADPREFGPAPEAPVEAVARAFARLDSGQVDRVAWVFGPERTGLSIEDVGRCQALVTIPADPVFASLNLSQAVQIIAFVLRQQALAGNGDGDLPAGATAVSSALGSGRIEDGRSPRRRHPKAAEAEALADHGAVEALLAHLEQALVAIDYLDPRHPRKLMPRMRRLFARAGLEKAEVELLRGVCRKIEDLAASPALRPAGAPAAAAAEAGGPPMGSLPLCSNGADSHPGRPVAVGAGSREEGPPGETDESRG